MKFCFFLSSLFLFPIFLSAQNIKDETIEYSYVKLPLQPIDKSVKNFQSLIIPKYEEENSKKKAAYEADLKAAEAEYQQQMKDHPAKVKAAEEKYKAEMEEWNKKSLGEKFVEKQLLEENNKPVKHTPSTPFKRGVNEPELKTSYEYPVLASTYLNLGGFERKPENAVNITVTMYGYDYTQPRQMTVQKNVLSGGTTSSVSYYYTEFSYRHPMSVTVTDPKGNVLLSLTPQELNVYKVYKTPESNKSQSINSDMLVKSYEEKALQENLKFIGDLVNDKFGYPETKRKIELQYVKSKDETYQDLLIAFNDAASGLRKLTSDPSVAQAQLEKASLAWNKALQESDPKNKKARIDKGVTIMICFNLLESYFALKNTAESEKIFTTLNAIDLSTKERKLKDEYEVLFTDLKKRIAVNN